MAPHGCEQCRARGWWSKGGAPPVAAETLLSLLLPARCGRETWAPAPHDEGVGPRPQTSRASFALQQRGGEQRIDVAFRVGTHVLMGVCAGHVRPWARAAAAHVAAPHPDPASWPQQRPPAPRSRSVAPPTTPAPAPAPCKRKAPPVLMRERG